jgi:hypothetical protein
VREIRNAYKIFVGHPEGKRPFGRHVEVRGNIAMDLYKEINPQL